VLAFRALAGMVRPRATLTKFEFQQMTFNTVEYTKETPKQLALKPSNPTTSKNNQIFTQLKQHYSRLAANIQSLERISKSYRPRLLKEHLDDNEKGLNVDIYDNAESEKSLERFIDTIENPSRAKELRVTFEKLRDLSGIGQLAAIEYASLQFNCLTSIEGLSANSKLIEVNLSHNNIARYDALARLKWLRYVDLEHNQIS